MAEIDSTENTRAESCDFEAAISDEQVKNMEKAATTQARGQQRRLCLLTCSRSSAVLRQLMEESPDAFLEVLDAVEAFDTHAKALVEISTAALARMILVGAPNESAAEA